jgi:hypothetical protein
MHNEKNHRIKHGGGDVAKYADIINMSYEAPEDGHNFCHFERLYLNYHAAVYAAANEWSVVEPSSELGKAVQT